MWLGLCICTLASYGHECCLGEGLPFGKTVSWGRGQFPLKDSTANLQKPIFPEAGDGYTGPSPVHWLQCSLNEHPKCKLILLVPNIEVFVFIYFSIKFIGAGKQLNI